MRERAHGFFFAAALALLGCGGRTPIDKPPPVPHTNDAGPSLQESCNGLDEDDDLEVDEDFRDGDGRYIDDAHCGRCDRACDAPIDHALAVGCQVFEGVPQCAARGCEEGFGPTRGGACAALDDHVCSACLTDHDCGPLASARCLEIGGSRACTRSCADGCPDGYTCFDGDHCEPESRSCECPLGAPAFTRACDVDGVCMGTERCEDGELSACELPEERCGGDDEDCDGVVDEGFVDARGAFSQREHCGACGNDCSRDTKLELTCGGDPFAPSCVLACDGHEDGIDVGDEIDADGVLDNGCECRVRSLEDPGAEQGEEAIDDNCDGADGTVLSSYYVAQGGSDDGPGSPTRPLASINEAIRRAHASLDTDEQRLDVYVAGGVYTETIRLLDGVQVHGGYREDFRARAEEAFEVTVVSDSEAPLEYGAALVAELAGYAPTLIEGFSLRGRDATELGAPAIGAKLDKPGPNLVLRNLSIRAGRAGRGSDGAPGVAGAAPSSEATEGDPPRAAIEDAAHECIVSARNTTRAGQPGRNVCDDVKVNGGYGGNGICPIELGFASAGDTGLGRADAPGGAGGGGGRDVVGPIEQGSSCSEAVCCGLADFSVPNPFELPQPGQPGSDGVAGMAGRGCNDGGDFDARGVWRSGTALAGTAGSAGGGGGGGGAGGGARMRFFEDTCEFVDGLGGAGGGGGAGGCGGEGGGAGQSGGASVAVLVVVGTHDYLPVIESCALETSGGGDGGNGGAGGDGGAGGSGGFGGRVPESERATPTLAGPTPGERGGPGGDGGAGGGGGGGCGGPSIGIGVAGFPRDATLPSLGSGNLFGIADGGLPGAGGGGELPGADGAFGARKAVHAW